MAARKKPMAKPAKPAAAPKSKIAAVKVIVATPPKMPTATVAAAAQSPKAPLAPRPATESGMSKDPKDRKKKKGKKMNDGDSSGIRKKMVRDSFTMPAPDYALIAILKARTLAAGTSVKKSELLRGGLVALAAMPPAQLIDLISALPAIKTGRPGKNKK